MHASSLMRRGNRVARLEPRERRQDVVQQLRQHVGQCGAEQVDAQAVEQVRDRAEEVAEEIAGAWDRRDVEDHFIELDGELKQIQIEGPEVEVQDRTGRLRHRRVVGAQRARAVWLDSSEARRRGGRRVVTGISTMAPATCCAGPVAGVIVRVWMAVGLRGFWLLYWSA